MRAFVHFVQFTVRWTEIAIFVTKVTSNKCFSTYKNFFSEKTTRKTHFLILEIMTSLSFDILKMEIANLLFSFENLLQQSFIYFCLEEYLEISELFERKMSYLFKVVWELHHQIQFRHSLNSFHDSVNKKLLVRKNFLKIECFCEKFLRCDGKKLYQKY